MKTYDKIKKISRMIQTEKFLNDYRISPKFFTRRRKISFVQLIYFILNKKGLSLSMEIDNFKETIKNDMKHITESAICQQRQKIKAEAFKELNREYIKDSYEDINEVKKIKGYLVFAIDGSDIELPNIEGVKKIFGQSGGQKGQRTTARAKCSCIYDVLNYWTVDSIIDKYTKPERDLAKENIEKMNKLIDNKIPKIIMFDRGYPSLGMMYLLDSMKIKYLFRIPDKNFKNEQKLMDGNDCKMPIAITKDRIRYLHSKEDKDLLKNIKEIETRFVKFTEEKIFITNLEQEEFCTKEIYDLYFKRWKIELLYEKVKNKMVIENFSGQSENIIKQEFYAQIFLLNIAEDLRKDANKKIKQTKGNGYKYDYQINMNLLIGNLRKKFIKIVIAMTEEQSAEATEEYYLLFKEIQKNLIPIRENRKNDRNKYKGYNKYKQNLRRNS